MKFYNLLNILNGVINFEIEYYYKCIVQNKLYIKFKRFIKYLL